MHFNSTTNNIKSIDNTASYKGFSGTTLLYSLFKYIKIQYY